MNLNDLQQYVWQQTDTTAVDLPAQTIEAYLHEAFTRTMSAETRWPFYEQGWQLTRNPGDYWIDMPVDMRGQSILSIFPVEGGAKLHQVNQEEAESRFSTHSSSGGGNSGYFSIWANKLYMWPLYTSEYPVSFLVRGYRQPLTPFDPVTGEVDADPRLHRCLAHYAIALAYAQQEDDVLEARSMDRWERDASMARKAIMDPAGHRPLVMYGNFPRRRGTPFSSIGVSHGGTGVSVVS